MADLSTIIAQCVVKNHKAQSQLYKMYAPMLKSLCYKYVSDGEVAKDLVQDSFIKIFDRIDSLKDHSAAAGWMKCILINTAKEYHRKKAIERKHVDMAASETDPPILLQSVAPEGVLQEFQVEFVLNIDPLKLQAILSSLSYPKNKIVLLYCYSNMSHAEISHKLGISESNCKVHYHRAKSLLKSMITKEMSLTNAA